MLRHSINHIAHTLHSREKLSKYSVRCVRVSKNPKKPAVSASWNGPLSWLACLGCAMSVTLIILSVVENDGMSLLAAILLSLLSTLIGIGSKSSLELPKRTSNRPVPDGNVVIVYPNGAFMIVKCEESIARELYWAPEKCHYMVNVEIYRFISLVGTLMLMFGVIFLANATQYLQLAWATAYIALNIAYWIVAALPQRLHWNLTSFDCEIEDYAGEEENKDYTQALWQAIAITRSTDWAGRGAITPRTKGWTDWLARANERAVYDPQAYDEITGKPLLAEWDCQTALNECLHPGKANEV